MNNFLFVKVDYREQYQKLETYDSMFFFIISYFFHIEKIMELEEQINLGSSEDSLVHKVCYLLRYFVFLNIGMQEGENKSYWKGGNLGNKTLPTILAIVMRWKVNIEAVSL